MHRRAGRLVDVQNLTQPVWVAGTGESALSHKPPSDSEYAAQESHLKGKVCM